MEHKTKKTRTCLAACDSCASRDEFHDEGRQATFPEATIQEISENVFRCPLCGKFFGDPQKDNATLAAKCQVADLDQISKEMPREQFNALYGEPPADEES